MINFKRISKFDIAIRHTANGGVIVNVGCCEASFTTPYEMLEALKEYYDDPDGMEKKYNAFAGPHNEVTSVGPAGSALAAGQSSRSTENDARPQTEERAEEDCQCEDTPEPRLVSSRDLQRNGDSVPDETESIDHPGNN